MAGNNRVQYTIGVNADTKQADAQLAKLSSTLDKIQKQAASKVTLDLKMDRAAESARVLQQSLQKATNIDTGKLNLSKFNQELHQAGVSLEELTSSLLQAGSSGSTAFVQLASSIAGAEVPIKRMNSTLANFATTLKNTVKWELSSKLVHGVESFLSGAINYAKDLNGTLNDIRIVTGASIADMSKFANQANKMAKELSATTQEVAKASLIYYQQGDSAELAAKKAEITTKAANVAFTASAQEMSQMLTAVWNSFQMGEDQLEHAVDVMANLGATTASSMEEMATAMQKVAATANNVGVSMEQMSAIVATSASVTRQAPQVVGTAWNTILSRLGGLKLGETLEDGVDLNKYSKALASIGVDVLDATGNLKDMGGVVDEIGAKWDAMTRAQQSALAQTIGGTRQYTQILAFFDNFEKYQKNLETANNSEGALNKQAEIYAQSWEAASKRQKAALQSVFTQVINDEAIIKVTNSLTTVIDRIGDIVKGFGGVQGILLTLGAVAMKVFNSQIATGIDSALTRIKSFGAMLGQARVISKKHGNERTVRDATGHPVYDEKGRERKTIVNAETGLGVDAKTRLGRFIGAIKQQGNYEMRQQRAAIQESKAQINASISEPGTNAEGIAQTSAQNLLTLKEKLLNTEYKLSAAQQKVAQEAISAYGKESEKLVELISKSEELEKQQRKHHSEQASSLYLSKGNKKGGKKSKAKKMNVSDIQQNLDKYVQNATVDQVWQDMSINGEEKLEMKDWQNADKNWNAYYRNALGTRVGQMIEAVGGDEGNKLQELYNKIGKLHDNGDDLSSVKSHVKELIEEMKRLGTEGAKGAEEAEAALSKLGDEGTAALNEAQQEVQERRESIQEIGNQFANTERSRENAEQSLEEKYQTTKFAQGMAKVASAAMTAMSSFSAMENTFSTMSDKSANFSQKVTSILSTVGNLTNAWSQGLISGLTATISAGLGLLIARQEQLEKNNQASRKQISDEINESTNKLVEDTEKAVEALKEYEKLKSQFEENEISRNEYVTGLTNITNSLDIEGTHVAELTGNYRELEIAIKNATAERLASNSKEAFIEYSNARDSSQTLLLSAKEQDSNSYIDLKKFQSQSNTAVESIDFLEQMLNSGESKANLKRFSQTDTVEEIFDLMFGGITGVSRGQDGILGGGFADDLYFESDIETLKQLSDRFKELREKASDVTNSMRGIYGAIISSIPFQNLESYVNSAVDPVKKLQAVSMKSFASEYLNTINKNTFVSNYKSNQEQFGRDALIQQILNVWDSKNIDISEYGEEDAKILAQQFVDAFLDGFSDLSFETATEKDAAAMRDQIYKILDNILSPEKASEIKDYIKQNWNNIFKDIFANMKNPYEFDWGSLEDTEIKDVIPNLQGLSEYNKATNKYETLLNYTTRNELTSADLPDILGLLNDEDISRIFDNQYNTVSSLQSALDNGLVDKTKVLNTILNDLTANIMLYYDAILGPATALQTSITKQVTDIQNNWKTRIGKPTIDEKTLSEYLENGQSIYDADKKDLANQEEKEKVSKILRDLIDNSPAFKEFMLEQLADMDTGLNWVSNEALINGQTDSGRRTHFSALTDEKLKYVIGVAQQYYTADSMQKGQQLNTTLNNLPEIKYGASTSTTSSKTIHTQEEAMVAERERQKAKSDAENAKREAEERAKQAQREKIKTDITSLKDINLKKLDVITPQIQALLNLDEQQVLDFHKLDTQSQEDFITQALKENKTKLENSYAEGEEISLEDKQVLAILTQLIQERENAPDKTNYETAYEATKTALQEQQTELTKMQSGANTLLNNYQTGKLDNVALNTLSQSGLGKLVQDYQTATTEQERLNIATQAYSQYLLQQQEYLTNQNKLYQEINSNINKMTDEQKESTDKITDSTQFIKDYFGNVSDPTKGLLLSAMQTVASKKGVASIADISVKEMLPALQEYVGTVITENNNAFQTIKATGIDTLTSTWEAAASEAATAAKSSVEEWETAFSNIAALREKLLKGESIAKDVFGDWTKYRDAYLASGEESYEEFNKKVLLNDDTLNLQQKDFKDYTERLKKNFGLTSQTVGRDGMYISAEAQMSAERAKFSRKYANLPEYAVNSMWASSNERKLAETYVRQNAKTLLQSYYGDSKTETEINDLVDQYMHGSVEVMQEAANAMNKVAEGMAQGTERDRLLSDVEIQQQEITEQQSTAKELLESIINGDVDTEWQNRLDKNTAKNEQKLQELADALNMPLEDLKKLSYEQIQEKYRQLGIQIDKTADEFNILNQAIAAGDFDGKKVSNYTKDGHILFETDQPITKYGSETGYDTEKLARQDQLEMKKSGEVNIENTKVVKGNDGKYYILDNVEESQVEAGKYTSTEKSNVAGESESALDQANKQAQEDWLSNRSKELEKLDALQIDLNNPDVKPSKLVNDWEALASTLDLTNESIAYYYKQMQQAGDDSVALQAAIDGLTASILQQGDVSLSDTESLKLMLKQFAELYKVTDKNGNALDYNTLMEIRLAKESLSLKNIIQDLGTKIKTYTNNTDYSSDSVKDLRTQLEKAHVSFDDFVDSLDDASDEEKSLLKDTNAMYDAFEELGHELGVTPDKLDNYVDSLVDATDTGDLVTKALSESSDEVKTAMSRAAEYYNSAEFKAGISDEVNAELKADLDKMVTETAAQCNVTEAEMENIFSNLMAELNAHNGDVSQINWGTVVPDLNIDTGPLISSLTGILNTANAVKAATTGTGFLSTFNSLFSKIGLLQKAIGLAKSVNNKGGGGGGGSNVKNDVAPTESSGGGGGNKTKKSLEKMQEDEKERYHEITKRIDEQSKELNKLDKIKSAAFGANHIKAINDEITALKKEKILYQELATEANRNLATNRSALAGFGATFNSDGTVNYDEFMNKITREYNAAVEKYNDTDAEDQKKAKIDLDYAKERYDKAKEALEKYEEDMEKVQDAEENLLDIVNQISAKTLEAIEYKIEVKFDINDRDIKYMQYLRNKWEDVLDKADESMEQMINEAKEYTDNLDAVRVANDELYKQYQEGNLTAADFAEGLKEINDKSIEMLENLITIKKSIKEAYGNALETANDELEKHTAVLEHSYSIMEKYIQIQQLIGMGTDYTGLKQMYEFQYKSSLASVEAAKLYLDVLKDEEVALQAQIDAYGWTEVLKQQWEDLQERIRDGESDLAEKTNQTLTTAQNAFSNAIKAAIEKFDEFVFGVRGGLSKLEADYQYYQEEQERYLSTSKELYEVAKLNREINGSLDEVTSQLTKTRLRELQEEIKSLSEKNRLTEYDVQMLELQYKYALALEDLEDKKNAKSIVRLTRDDNGNYGYQYTADSDEIDKAAQQVDDVLQQINELAANRTAEIEQAAISAQRNYYDNLEQISNDTSLSIEERQARIEELTQRYAETMQFNQEQYNNATNALLTNQEYVYKRYGTSIMENTGMIQDQMNSAITAMINKTDDWSAYLSTQLQPGGEIYEALETYKQQLDETNISAGLGNRQQAVQNMTKSIDDLTEANEAADEAIRNIADTLDDTLKNINAQTAAWQELTGSIQEAIDAYEQLAQTSGNKIGELGKETVNTGVGGENIKPDSKDVYAYKWTDEYGITHTGDWSYDSYSSAMEGASQSIKAFYSSYLTAGEDDAETAANKAKYDSLVDAALDTRSAPSTQVATFLRGGMIDFTGPAWVDGSTSSPESILNAGDTAKMLRMTELIHNIDLEALRMLYESINQSAIGMMYPLNGLLNSQSINPFATELQQHVTITAEFPNATDHSEIEQAFEDIVNLAAQYAGRK